MLKAQLAVYSALSEVSCKLALKMPIPLAWARFDKYPVIAGDFSPKCSKAIVCFDGRYS
jgi:hypothetical protein